MRARPPPEEKPLHWVASSKRDLLRFPERVVDNIGYALGVVQYGGRPPSAKALKGLGSGVLEIVEDAAAGTFRAVYTVRFKKAIYVLHAFHKKSPSAIRTARPDIGLIGQRLKAARLDYEARYGEEEID